MTEPVVITRFEFAYTTVPTGDEPGVPVTFALSGYLGEEVAHGIRIGLQAVPTITDVTATAITETGTTVPVYDFALTTSPAKRNTKE
jgi:hypothetical protein